MLDFLREEHIDEGIIQGILEFRKKYGTGESYTDKTPRNVYYGKEIWEQAAQALLCGKNLLLAGAKATGKNMLAENLAEVFWQRFSDVPAGMSLFTLTWMPPI